MLHETKAHHTIASCVTQPKEIRGGEQRESDTDFFFHLLTQKADKLPPHVLAIMQVPADTTGFLCDQSPHSTSHQIYFGKLGSWSCQHNHKNLGHKPALLDITRVKSFKTKIKPWAFSYLTCSTASAVWSNSPESSYTTHSSCSGTWRSFSSKSSCTHSKVKVLTRDSHRKGSLSCTMAFRAEYSTSTTCRKKRGLRFLQAGAEMALSKANTAQRHCQCRLSHANHRAAQRKGHLGSSSDSPAAELFRTTEEPFPQSKLHSNPS